MRKKNVLVMGLSMALVAVISIGGTLAYLTDSDQKITNTFEFATGLEVSLSETWAEGNRKANETVTSVSGGYSYTNVVAGQDLYKAPEVSVETDVDAYVFVRVDESKDVTVKDYKTGEGEWNTLANADYKVLYKEVSADDTSLGKIFETVNVSAAATGTLEPITIEVAAIQKVGFDNAEKAYEYVSQNNIFTPVNA